MAERLYGRRVRVVIASRVAEDFSTVSTEVVEVEAGMHDKLRVQFKVEKSLEKSPNTCEVTVTNFAEATRSRLQEKGGKILLFAGYEPHVGQLFVGDVRSIDHVRDGGDWATKILAGDGERGFLNARISESFAGGVRVPRIVDAAAQKMTGHSLTGDISGLDRQYVNGYVAHGPASREMDKALRGTGYTWSVQDGRVQVVREGGTNLESVAVISPDTGLVGSPEHGTSDKPGKPPMLKVKSLLLPDLKCAGRVRVLSEKYKGTYVAQKIVHTGDTNGGEWYTEMETEVAP